MDSKTILGGKIIIAPLLKAQKSLSSALGEVTTDLTRDGAIQRFEYSFELAWKTMKRILNFKGSKVEHPRDVIREAAAAGWISDPKLWFGFLEARNKTAHIYQEEIAKEVFAVLPDFMIELDSFVKKISKL